MNKRHLSGKAACAMLTAALLLSGIGAQSVLADEMGYTQITMEDAQKVFAEENTEDYIIVDVRTAQEYAEGHIPGAVNVPNETITDQAGELLPDKEEVLYVYCRSGNRSREAAGKLVDMGYTQVIECGGIKDWNGEIEAEASLVYIYGEGYGEEGEQSSIMVAVTGEDTIQLSAQGGALTKELSVPAEMIHALQELVEKNLPSMYDDMSDTCVASRSFSYLVVDGEKYGGYAVQNKGFTQIEKKLLEIVGQDKLDAFVQEVSKEQ